jgi:hypothetical protein
VAAIRRLALALVVSSCAREQAPVSSAAPVRGAGGASAPASRLAFEASLVELAGRFGVVSSLDVRLTGALARDARPAIVGGEGAEVTASVLSPEGSRPPGVRLTLSGRHAGRGVGHVVVSTGLGDPRELVLYYGWSVPGNLTVSPSNPYLDLRGPGAQVVEIAVASSRPDFRLQRAEVVAGPFAASVAPARAAGHYQVRVRAVERGVSDGDRGFLGKLILISNDPAEPRKEIPLLAMGPLHPSAGSRP